MTDVVRNWLPKEAFSERAVATALAPLVSAWSADWLGDRSASVTTVRIAAAADGAAGLPAVDLPGRGKRNLVEAALNFDLTGQALLEGDHKLVDALATQTIEDLIAKLDEALGGKQEANDGFTVDVTLAVDRNEILTVALPAHALVPLLKDKVAKTPSDIKVAQKRQAAIGPTKIILEGHLGDVEIAIEDLWALSAGDVLVLDRSVEETVALRLSDGDRDVARGRLSHSNGQVAIQL